MTMMLLSANAQSSDCDEGVIRLPDRSGTIQICSALSAKVPQLSRQLSEISKGYSSQQQQIAELTRLVRGLSNVGRNLEQERQGRMLQSLSAELAKSMSAGGETSQQVISNLNEKLDELQSKLFSTLANPAGASTIVEAIKGPLGEAIANLDLSRANQQLQEISERLRALQSDVAAVKTDTAAIRDALKGMATEIKALGGRGGLVDNPKTYAEHYHNARIHAQRGEVDLALAAYQKVLHAPIQLADPIIDMVTLLQRMYGREGAGKYIDKNLKRTISKTSYIYANQLLAAKQTRIAYELMLKNLDQFLSFPPLGALYLRKMEDKEDLDYPSFPWSDLIMFLSVASSVGNSMESGEYLSFFADQIRGGNDIETFDQIKKYFDPDKLLVMPLLNYTSEAERGFHYRLVKINSSPVALDFTYYLDPPTPEVMMMMSDWDWFAPQGIDRFDILIWDAGIDRKSPIEVCAKSGNTEECLNMSAPDKSCKREGQEGEPCVRGFFVRKPFGGQYEPAWALNRINPTEMLGARCLSRIRYTDEDGRKIEIPAKNLIATYRGLGSELLLSTMKGCGYDIQVEQEVKRGFLKLR